MGGQDFNDRFLISTRVNRRHVQVGILFIEISGILVDRFGNRPTHGNRKVKDISVLASAAALKHNPNVATATLVNT